jgi:ethanolamine ammonia-lyase small subunit
MTIQTKKKRVIALNRNIEKNLPRISRRLSKAGIKIDQVLLVSAAKYYEALEKLAKE